MAVKDVNARNYEENVVLSVNPVVINMYMQGMKQCEINEKVLDEIQNEYGDYIKVVKVDLVKQPSLRDLFEIESIPMIIMLDGGIIIKKIPGNPSKEELIEMLEVEKIKEFRAKGIYYKPQRNYIPDYIEDQRW